MERIREQRLAVITDFCTRAPGSSLGRTAVMKLCYFAQVLKDVPLYYRFTLYSYGPFDSEVLSDLATAESAGALTSSLVYYTGGYGYNIRKGDHADSVIRKAKSFLDNHRVSMDWVLSEFACRRSADLELESTVVFVDREAHARREEASIDELTQRVRDVKPHFAEAAIRSAVIRLHQRNLLLNPGISR